MQHIISIVPRHSYNSLSLYQDGKNCAVLRSLRPQRNPTPKRGYYSPASIRLRNVYALYCRAVSKNACKEIGLAPYLDKFIMTSKFCGTLTENADAHTAL
jgi:hypothetical protein